MMAQSPHCAEFPSTRWSLVERARGADAFFRREALESLVALYWPALRAHLIIRRKLSLDAADDLLQGFAAERVLQRQFLGHADPARGRFRSFLLRCLENYWIDQLRKPHPSQPFDDEHQADLAAPAGEPDAFDVAWARQVLEETIRRFATECREPEKLPLWSLFELRVLRPTLTNATPIGYSELVNQFGFASPEQAANALVTAKRHFRRVLEDVVAEYVESEAEVQSEIADLRAILAAGRATETIMMAIRSSPLAEEGLARREPVESEAKGPSDAGAENGTAKVPRTPRADLAATATNSNPSSLSRLFQIDGHLDSAWDHADFAGLVQHLLQLPLSEAMPGLDAAAFRSPDPQGAVGPSTLAELFTHSTPPLALLEAVKLWSRRATRDDQPILPSDAASLLYFAAIAAARVRRGQWISKLDPSLLKQGIEMLLSQAWVGEPLRGLLQEFRAFAEPPDTR